MRELLNPQLQLGQVDIGCIEFDLQSRDDILRIPLNSATHSKVIRPGSPTESGHLVQRNPAT